MWELLNTWSFSLFWLIDNCLILLPPMPTHIPSIICTDFGSPLIFPSSQEEINATFHCSRHWRFTSISASVISRDYLLFSSSCFQSESAQKEFDFKCISFPLLHWEAQSLFSSWQLTQSVKEDFIYSTKIHHNSDLFLWTRAWFGGNVHYMLKASNLMKSVVSLPPHPPKTCCKITRHLFSIPQFKSSPTETFLFPIERGYKFWMTVHTNV